VNNIYWVAVVGLFVLSIFIQIKIAGLTKKITKIEFIQDKIENRILLSPDEIDFLINELPDSYAVYQELLEQLNAN